MLSNPENTQAKPDSIKCKFWRVTIFQNTDNFQEVCAALVWHCRPPANVIHTNYKAVFKRNNKFVFYYQ